MNLKDAANALQACAFYAAATGLKQQKDAANICCHPSRKEQHPACGELLPRLEDAAKQAVRVVHIGDVVPPPQPYLKRAAKQAGRVVNGGDLVPPQQPGCDGEPVTLG